MMPVSISYDEYIDRPKLTEQKTNLSKHFLSPPKWVGTKIYYSVFSFITPMDK